MTVVYIDSLFLLNFIVDYLLLLATAKLGALLCLWRWNFCHWTAGGTGTHSAERHPLLGYGSEDHIALGGCLLCGTYIGVQQDCETLQT